MMTLCLVTLNSIREGEETFLMANTVVKCAVLEATNIGLFILIDLNYQWSQRTFHFSVERDASLGHF